MTKAKFNFQIPQNLRERIYGLSEKANARIEIVEKKEVDEVILENAIKDIEYSPNQKARIPSVSHLSAVARDIVELAPTVTECRIPIFVPLARVSETSEIFLAFKKGRGIREISTSWGKAFVRGRVLLTQTHRDLLDTVLVSAKKITYSKVDGSIQVYFCGRDVLRFYGGNQGNTNWLTTMLEQIRDTVVKYQAKDKERKNRNMSFDFNILRRVVYSKQEDMFYIEFDPSYVAFYQTEIIVCYKKVLPQILACDNGLLKSIVRFFVSHKQIVISLDNLLHSIGYILDKETQSKKYYRLRKMIQENADKLSSVGIFYDSENEKFFYEEHSDVYSIMPILKDDEKSITFQSLSKVSDLIDKWNKCAFKSKVAKGDKSPTLFDDID